MGVMESARRANAWVTVDIGLRQLKRLLPNMPVSIHTIPFDRAGVWMVATTIRTPEATVKFDDEPMVGFPSEKLQAQIALVA